VEEEKEKGREEKKGLIASSSSVDEDCSSDWLYKKRTRARTRRRTRRNSTPDGTCDGPCFNP
jgi:hypothetical protein